MERNEAGYVIWLDDEGTEALSFAPLSWRTGWARYFRKSGTWAGVMICFGLRHRGEPPGDNPIRVCQMAATVGDHDWLLPVGRDVPHDRLVRVVNQARHYDVLAPWLPSQLLVGIPDRGSWSSELPTIRDDDAVPPP